MDIGKTFIEPFEDILDVLESLQTDLDNLKSKAAAAGGIIAEKLPVNINAVSEKIDDILKSTGPGSIYYCELFLQQLKIGDITKTKRQMHNDIQAPNSKIMQDMNTQENTQPESAILGESKSPYKTMKQRMTEEVVNEDAFMTRDFSNGELRFDALDGIDNLLDKTSTPEFEGPFAAVDKINFEDDNEDYDFSEYDNYEGTTEDLMNDINPDLASMKDIKNQFADDNYDDYSDGNNFSSDGEDYSQYELGDGEVIQDELDVDVR